MEEKIMLTQADFNEITRLTTTSNAYLTAFIDFLKKNNKNYIDSTGFELAVQLNQLSKLIDDIKKKNHI